MVVVCTKIMQHLSEHGNKSKLALRSGARLIGLQQALKQATGVTRQRLAGHREFHRCLSVDPFC